MADRGAGRLARGFTLSAAGGAMLAWTWRTWPDLVVDFGRELYVPWRLSAGEVLYLDIAYFNGPLSPYWNALWFRWLGVGLDVLVAINLVLLVVLTVLLHRLLVAVSSPLPATFGTASFLLLFAFGSYVEGGNYTYLAPYSHEMTHGLLLSLVALYCLGRFTDGGRPGWAAACGLSVGLVFLTKPEIFVAVAVAVAGGFAFGAWSGRRWGPTPPDGARGAVPSGPGGLPARVAAGVLGAGVLVPPLAAGLLLSRPLGWEAALQATAGGWSGILGSDVASLAWYRQGMGVDRVGSNLVRLAAALGVWGLVLLPALVSSFLLRRDGRRRPIAAGVAFAVTGAALVALVDTLPWQDAVRPLPVLVPLLAGVGILGADRGGEGRSEHCPLSRRVLQLSLVLFAVALLGKMILNVRIHQYGFVLAMPATVLVVVGLTAWVPRAVDRAGGTGGVFRGGALGALTVFLLVYLGGMAGVSGKTFPVGKPPDAFLTDPSRGPAAAEFLSALAELPPGATLLVVPEGAMLNYLARIPSPSRYLNFMPPELALFGEEAILADLRESTPDYVAVVHRDTSEYGAPFFGTDYGGDVMRWIERDYRDVRLMGEPPLEPGTEFGIRLLERR